MKTTQRTTAKKLLAGVFASALCLGAVSAEPINGGKAPPPAENPLHVHYIGVDHNYLVFEITVEADNLKHPELLIDDANDGSLYSQGFSGSITEKIKIERNDDLQLSFKLIAGKETFSKLFTINTVSVENTTVSENTDNSYASR
jgi:hypothetical protein